MRIITELAWQHHFAKNMFIRPDTEAETEGFEPDFTIINACKVVNDDYKVRLFAHRSSSMSIADQRQKNGLVMTCGKEDGTGEEAVGKEAFRGKPAGRTCLVWAVSVDKN